MPRSANVQKLVRMPANLKEWLEDRSIRNFRNANAEIVAILAAVREGEETDAPGEGFRPFASR